ncbi:TrmH family RNA methyltransferase [Tunturiibacter lichenicola]|uniref:TrmH family RNA methyltransferase n=1 Tax=Tunturiibacter lichenicola TaxID=2051959 RepID=UPI003D9AFFAE
MTVERGAAGDGVRFVEMQTPEIVVSSRANARVKQLRAAFQGHARLSGGMVAIEGDHLLEEALRSGMVLKTVFVSERRAVPKVVPRGVEVLRLTEEVFGSVVETQSPQGVAALVVPPVRTLADLFEGAGAALILIAVGLQDPGNMGTLVRSAEAFGANGVLTTAGTVSAWNQKALRASVGSVFRVPVAGVTAEEVAELKGRGVRLIAAVGADDFGVVAAREMDFTTACAVMIGNEGSGLAAEWMEMCDARVTIPCPGPVESLNAAVAGSLLLYEASRQRSGGGLEDEKQKRNTGILRSAQDDDFNLDDGIKEVEITRAVLKQGGR